MSQPERKTPRYDSLWKALPLEVLLALLSTVVAGIGPLQPWKVDLKQIIDRESDGVFLTTIDGIKTLVLVEYQNYLDTTMPWRIYEYVFLLQKYYWQEYHEHIPVLPIVIWAIEGTLPKPIYQNIVAGEVYGFSRYREIQLNTLDWHGLDPVVLVLAPFLKDVTPQELPEIAAKLYQGAPDHLKTLLMGALLALSQRTFQDVAELEATILAQARTTMDVIYETIKESKLGAALLAEGRKEGEEVGRREGEIKGLERALATLWQKRFGEDIPEAEVERLAQLPPVRYEAVLAALVDPTTSAAQILHLIQP